jgi:hypothetical protein
MCGFAYATSYENPLEGVRRIRADGARIQLKVCCLSLWRHCEKRKNLAVSADKSAV